MEFMIFVGLIYAYFKWDDQFQVMIDLLIEIRDKLNEDDPVKTQAPVTPPTNTPNRGTAGRPTVDRRKR